MPLISLKMRKSRMQRVELTSDSVISSAISKWGAGSP
jgi:hypothetical protein